MFRTIGSSFHWDEDDRFFGNEKGIILADFKGMGFAYIAMILESMSLGEGFAWLGESFLSLSAMMPLTKGFLFNGKRFSIFTWDSRKTKKVPFTKVLLMKTKLRKSEI